MPLLSILDKDVEAAEKNEQNRKTPRRLRAGSDRKISSMNSGIVSKMWKTLHRFIVSTAVIILDTHYFCATAAPMQCVKTTNFQTQSEDVTNITAPLCNTR